MRSRRTRRILLVSVALLAFAFVAACGPSVAPAPPIGSTPQADDVVARTNYLRLLGGTGQMTVDGNMQAHAQAHAARLAAGSSTCVNSLWHSPELGLWYPNQGAAENVACVPGCPKDGAQVIDLWMGSPSHRANMLNPAYSYTGTAASCNGSVMFVVGQYRSG
jgi:uncharacterized protein YkwD